MARADGIAEKIVDYLRTEGAFSNTDGTTFTTARLAQILICLSTSCGRTIRKLLDAKIIAVKKGKYTQGRGQRNNPPYFALAEGYEQGDSWKEVFGIGSSNGNTRPSSSKPVRNRPQKMVPLDSMGLLKAHAETMAKLEKSLDDNNKLRAEMLQALKEKNMLKEKVALLQAEMAELRDNEREAQRQLIEADNGLAMATKRISDQEKRQATLDRQISAAR